MLFTILYLPLSPIFVSACSHAHYMLRTDPRWTKAEIREYLLKVYGVRCARIATYISAGTLKRVTGRRELYRTKTHKKVYIRVEGDIANPLVAEPPPPAAELR